MKDNLEDCKNPNHKGYGVRIATGKHICLECRDEQILIKFLEKEKANGYPIINKETVDKKLKELTNN